MSFAIDNKTRWLVLLTSATALLFVNACTKQDDDENGATDSDTDVDTDSDDDSDACADCTSTVCIAHITGTVEMEDGTPVEGIDLIKFCAPGCTWISTDENGDFDFEFEEGCAGFDFDEALPLVAELPVELETEINHYIFGFAPTQQEVSDQGQDDFTLDLGLQVLHYVPDSIATYTETGGANVSSEGLSFDVAPGELGTENLDFQILKAPLETWTPPFIDNPYLDSPVDSVDALYYIAPYWTRVAAGDGIVYNIDPPTGWQEGDLGSVYVLGDWYTFYMEFPSGDDVPRGEFVRWGPTSWVDGRLVTPPIPVLSWLAVAKD